MAVEAAIILPIAASGLNSCVRWGIRKLNKIQKICIILPKECGKSTLCSKLCGDPKKLLIDCDKFSEPFDTDNILRHTETNPALQIAIRGSVLDKVYDYVRSTIRGNKSQKALFFTSDYQWALKRFKKDSIFVLVPSKDFNEQLSEKALSDRASILYEFDKKQIHTFSTWAELEAIISTKFGLQHPA